MLLLYHFERDAEKGLCNLRSLVQAEIKFLRTCGYKEKDLIPTTLYRRAFETLTNLTLRSCPFATPNSSVTSKQEPCYAENCENNKKILSIDDSIKMNGNMSTSINMHMSIDIKIAIDIKMNMNMNMNINLNRNLNPQLKRNLNLNLNFSFSFMFCLHLDLEP